MKRLFASCAYLLACIITLSTLGLHAMPAPMQGIAANLRQHINVIRAGGAHPGISTDPQSALSKDDALKDQFSKLLGEIAIKARGKLSFEHTSNAEIYFNEVFNNGSQKMKFGLADMIRVLGQEIDKIKWSGVSKYRTIQQLLREIFKYLDQVAREDMAELAKVDPTHQSLTGRANQADMVFLLYRSLNTALTVVNRGVREWLKNVPWGKILLGAGLLYGGYKAYKNKTLQNLLKLLNTTRESLENVNIITRHSIHERNIFMKAMEIDWDATLEEFRKTEKFELKRFGKMHENKTVYLVKQSADAYNSGYPTEANPETREVFENRMKGLIPKEQHTAEENTELQNRLQAWKRRIQAFADSEQAQWRAENVGTFQQFTDTLGDLKMIFIEGAEQMRTNRQQYLAWIKDNGIAVTENEAKQQVPTYKRALRPVAPQKIAAAQAQAEHDLPGATEQDIRRRRDQIILSDFDGSTYQSRFLQAIPLTHAELERARVALGVYFSVTEPGAPTAEPDYAGLHEVIPTLWYSASPNADYPATTHSRYHRTFVQAPNVMEQLIEKVFNPLNDPTAISGRIAHEAGLLMQNSRRDAELWLASIQPYTPAGQDRPQAGWPRRGINGPRPEAPVAGLVYNDPEYDTHKNRQFVLGSKPSQYNAQPHDFPDNALPAGVRLYRHYPAENILQQLIYAIGSINRPDSPVGAFLNNLGQLFVQLNEGQRTEMAPFLVQNPDGSTAKPYRFKSGARRRQHNEPGSEYHNRIYWTILADPRDENSAETNKKWEAVGVSGLWDALGAVANPRGSTIQKLVDTLSGAYNAISDDDPRAALTLGTNVGHVGREMGVDISGYGFHATFGKKLPPPDLGRIPNYNIDESMLGYKRRLEELRTQVIQEKKAITKPRGWLRTAARKAEYASKKMQEDELKALILHVTGMIVKIDTIVHRSGDQIMTDRTAQAIQPSPARARGARSAHSYADSDDGSGPPVPLYLGPPARRASNTSSHGDPAGGTGWRTTP